VDIAVSVSYVYPPARVPVPVVMVIVESMGNRREHSATRTGSERNRTTSKGGESILLAMRPDDKADIPMFIPPPSARFKPFSTLIR